MIWCLASLRRVRQGIVPRVRQYYQDTMTSCRSSHITSLPSFRGTTEVICGNGRISQVPGWPQCLFARALRLRRVGSFQTSDVRDVGFQNYRMAPAIGTTKALAKYNLSKLNRTAFKLAVYASSRSLPRATQDSLPVVGQTLPDGFSTRRVTIKGFRFTSCLSSPSAKLLGAIPFIVKTADGLASKSYQLSRRQASRPIELALSRQPLLTAFHFV